jgi:hypothetical protein
MPDVVRRDDPLDPAAAVEDDHLGRPAVAEVRDRVLATVQRRRPVDHDLAPELAPGERLEGPGVGVGSVERLAEARAGPEDGAAAEHGRARGGRLAGVELV